MREKQHLWIVRHAERQDIIDPTWYETAKRPYDTPLSCLFETSLSQMCVCFLTSLLLSGDGLKQASATGEFIASQACPTLIISSPYLRCIQTAGRIAAAAIRCRKQHEDSDMPPLEFVVDPSLSEWSNPRTYGTLTPGLLASYDEVLKSNPELTFLQRFTLGYTSAPIQSTMPRWVEDVMALHSRCQRVVSWVSDPHNSLVRKHGSIVLVSHGFSVVMLGAILDPTVPWHNLPSPYCCLTHMTTERRFCSCCPSPLQDQFLQTHRLTRSVWKTVLACSTEHLKTATTTSEDSSSS